ncbi:TOMM precursor leader peptide-binding protein [Desmospora activa]|uniref:Ribosomal protein S12 methylthiotransferase accessory factor n=1 Tax=Desmospora activa DSM 45169 TaxID=1121389 RepID=A0A2T4ZAW7_9BACL|nr:TOMM precursor leader peptide-binding protein [Desmospora activa]PTM59043.1 ribosomal protein S12 methylthiotransferase accessory factor [Desmospora activa DSM 45169]
MSRVVLMGEGVLAELVYDELSKQYPLLRLHEWEAGVAGAAELALVVHDAWYPAVHYQAEEQFRSAGIPWLRGFVSFGEGVVGPLVRPDSPGCSRCADGRRLMAGRDRQEIRALQQKLEEHGKNLRDPWGSRTGLLQVAHLLAAEARRVLQGEPPHLQEQIALINLKTLANSHHLFLPDPLCPVCSRLPADTADNARISLKPSPKMKANHYRCRPLDNLKKVLAKDYLDTRTGVLNGKWHDLDSPFAAVAVNLPLFAADELSAGRTLSYEESELTAILESLERYCGLGPRGKRTTIRDCYRNLEGQALHPLTVGVHAEEQYARPGFPFQPFDPERVMDWVWGWSFLQERPLLVPQLLAYYSLGCGNGFVYETSNGCALGGSLEEAIFYGLLEVVERDSFLLTWYAQLPLPRLDLASVDDGELRLMVERLRVVAGYELHLYNATMENGIPSVWAIAKNRKSEGTNLICAAGAHPDPLRAVKSAIHELAGMLPLNEKWKQNREKAYQMYHDSSQVRQMEDHSTLYGLPQAEERLHFLLDENRPWQCFDEAWKPPKKNMDLTADLQELLQKFHRLQLDVIVVDQTTPEIRRNGLFCVKVLIPGMLPMTFGHHLTRVTGLERVLKVPVKLGYAKQPLTYAALNPHPHPFP